MSKVVFNILGKYDIDERISQLYTKVISNKRAWTLLNKTIEDTDGQAYRMDVETLEIWQNEINILDDNRYNNYYAIELIYTLQKLMDIKIN